MLSQWILSAMVAWNAPESAQDAERYEAIARDIAAVAEDPDEEPVKEGRAQTALLLTTIAYWESGFRADIDSGKVRGDHGASVCLMQIRVGRYRTAEGWSAADLIADRRKCLRAGLSRVRESVQTCRFLATPDRLGMYVRGRCMKMDPVSRMRMRWAQNWWARHGHELPT